jgi:glycosyltransferase involved in cell wall biosynthesis
MPEFPSSVPSVVPAPGAGKVAVIVRTQDRPECLRRALASVKAQTWTNWQIVVVDDGGAATEVDTAVAKAGVPADALQVIHHAVPVGRAGACNAAIRSSDSEFIAVLDDDDTWHPEFLSRCLGVMATLPADGAERGVVTRTTEIDELWANKTCREKRRIPFNADLNVVSLADLAVENQFTINAFVYRRNALREVGLYDESLPVLEDWEFNVRFVARFAVRVIPEYLAFYHRRRGLKDGMMANSAKAQHQQQMIAIKNRWLRADLASGRFGLGWLAATGKTIAERRLARMLNRILNLNWRRFF